MPPHFCSRFFCKELKEQQYQSGNSTKAAPCPYLTILAYQLWYDYHLTPTPTPSTDPRLENYSKSWDGACKNQPFYSSALTDNHLIRMNLTTQWYCPSIAAHSKLQHLVFCRLKLCVNKWCVLESRGIFPQKSPPLWMGICIVFKMYLKRIS
jgi:hypothetical protein